MAIQGAIVPRSDATAQQLKELASALQAWFAASLKDAINVDAEADGWIDTAAVDDLKAGELPQPFALRLLKNLPRSESRGVRKRLELIRLSSPMAARIIPPGNIRSVSFGFSVTDTDQDRQRLIESLRCFVPLDCIAEVVINGMSFDIMTQ